jgi:hypothetical protein
MAVVYTGGKYCGSIFQFASNGATQLAAPFSSCNTKSGAVASFHNAIFQFIVILFTTALPVTRLSLSTCQSTTNQFHPLIAHSTLKVQSISTLPVVSTSFKCAVHCTVKSSTTVKSSDIVTAPLNVELPATVTFHVTVSFPLIAKLPLTVAQFNEVFPVVVKLFNVVFQLEVILPAVTSPVKEEVHVTDNCPRVALSEVSVVTLQFVALKLVIVASVEVNVDISHVLAVNVHATDTAELAATFHVNVEVSFTINVSVVTELAVAVPNELVVDVKLHITAVSIFHVVAFNVVALTVVQVNVQSEVILPVNSTSQLTVCNVTLDKSKFIPSIASCNAFISREIL